MASNTNTMKIVINKCFGGFGLSPLAIKEYLSMIGKECFFYKRDYKSKREIYNKVSLQDADTHDVSVTKDFGDVVVGHKAFYEEDYNFYYGNFERTDPNLIAVVEKLGEHKASGTYAKLSVVEIPDGVEYEIDEYDGAESIHEKHRIWG